MSLFCAGEVSPSTLGGEKRMNRTYKETEGLADHRKPLSLSSLPDGKFSDTVQEHQA